MLRETYIPVEQNYFMMFLVISWITTSKQVIKRKKKLKQDKTGANGCKIRRCNYLIFS